MDEPPQEPGTEGSRVSTVGVAVILFVIIAAMVNMKVARMTVVVVCVLFGLVLGASPIGDGVNAALAAIGSWTADRIGEL